MHMYMYAYMYVYILKSEYIGTHLKHADLVMCPHYVCMHVCMYVCIYIYIYIHTRTYTYMYAYVYVYILKSEYNWNTPQARGFGNVPTPTVSRTEMKLMHCGPMQATACSGG